MRKLVPSRSRSRARYKGGRGVAAAIESLEGRLMLAADLVISEFMAANNSTIQDSNKDFSDWIEIYNRGDAAANLNGWSLTDDPADLRRWRFPSQSLAAGGYLLVFASGKNRSVAGQELHTNFKLDASGDYLALVGPDGAVRFDYGPKFPKQDPDESYGLATEAGGRFLVGDDAPMTGAVPDAAMDGAIGNTWRDVGFDDSGWQSGTVGAGYEVGTGYESLIGLDLKDAMYTVNTSAYARTRFYIADPAQIQTLTLRMKFDDGFVAFLNGKKVANSNDVDPLYWQARAAGDRGDNLATEFVNFPVSNPGNALRAGENVLAIQGLNYTAESSDFLVLPNLVTGETVHAGSDETKVFKRSTPGGPNQPSAPAAPYKPVFSVGSQSFSGQMTVQLTTDAPAGAQIRYTLDRSVPGPSSPLYTGPITLTYSTLVRARVYLPGGIAGPPVSANYVSLDSTVQNFSSNIPLVVIDTWGQGMGDVTLTPVTAYFIGVGETGRARMLDAPDWGGRGGMRLRGQSSQGFPKTQYAFETWDENNDDLPVSLLGMPRDSDWILYAPYSEKSLMQNYLAYMWSNRQGQYAVRTQYVELFVKRRVGGSVSYTTDYEGVYILMEKIKVDNDRVNITPLLPTDNAEPNISGGYIFKKDKPDGNESGFTTSRGQWMLYVEPKESELTPAQKTWLTNYMNAFETALYGPNFADPVNGYAKYIDVDSWIDHHIMVELAKNIDGFRLSTYFHKDRNGKLKMGPIWDYNLSMGNADYLSGGWPDGWYYSQLGDAEYPYWRRLFQDPNFQQKWIDRWEELRRDAFSTQRLMQDIDEATDLLLAGTGNYPVGRVPTQEPNNPAVRNFKRWNVLGTYLWPNYFISDSWMDEVNHVKEFISQRAEWIDSQYLAAPLLSHETGRYSGTVQLSITSLSGAAIYYTTDGSDPRLPGGGINPAARRYSAPLSISRSTRVRARAYAGSWATGWSGIADAAIGIDTGLRISEVMYNPRGNGPGNPTDADEYEYIELTNTGPAAINLAGYRFANGIDFVFPTAQPYWLAPGAYAVIAANASAFAERYPGVAIAGVYAGLRRLSNAGETIELLDTVGAPVHRFAYDDDDAWSGRADGDGSSLEPVDFNGDYGDPHNWRPSVDFNGSPGRAGRGALGIVVNEVLSNSDAPTRDAVELYNTTGAAVDIGGWLLSDEAGTLRKYEFPRPTWIGAGGYLRLDESAFNPTPQTPAPNHFAIDGTHGDDLWLVATDLAGNVVAFSDDVHFDASFANQTLGRWPNGVGRLFPQAAPSLESVNRGPRTAGVMISEVMFDPAGGPDREYIEVYNNSPSPVDLSNWRLTRGVEFTFPINTILGGFGSLVVVPFNQFNGAKVIAFRNAYGMDATMPILGGYKGRLDAHGEGISLQQPDAPSPADPTFIPHVTVDEVDYRGWGTWPALGEGVALARVTPNGFGNDAAVWAAESPSPGMVTFSQALVRGTFDSDAFLVRLDPTGQNVEIYRNARGEGTPAVSRPASLLMSIMVGGLDGDDELIVDFANGNPLPPSGIQYDGGRSGTGIGDTLTLQNAAAIDVTCTPANSTGAGLLLVEGRGINYSNIEVIAGGDLRDLKVITPNADDTLTLDRPKAGSHRLRGSSGSAGMAFMTFNNVRTLILDLAANDGGAGNDSLNIGYSAVPASGLGTVRLLAGTGSNALNVNAGPYTFEIPGGENLTLNANIAAAATLVGSTQLGAMNLGGMAKVEMSAGGDKVLRTRSLAVSSNAALNLNDNLLIVQAASAAAREQLRGTLLQLLATGRKSGLWSGNGINSGTVASDATSLTSLGLLSNTRPDGTPLVLSFGGESVDENSLIVQHAWTGDVDMNGVVDADDYFRIDRGRLRGLSGWDNGDLDYDGLVQADDYALMDRTFAAMKSKPQEMTASRELAEPATVLQEAAVAAPAKKTAAAKKTGLKKHAAVLLKQVAKPGWLKHKLFR